MLHSIPRFVNEYIKIMHILGRKAFLSSSPFWTREKSHWSAFALQMQKISPQNPKEQCWGRYRPSSTSLTWFSLAVDQTSITSDIGISTLAIRQQFSSFVVHNAKQGWKVFPTISKKLSRNHGTIFVHFVISCMSELWKQEQCWMTGKGLCHLCTTPLTSSPQPPSATCWHLSSLCCARTLFTKSLPGTLCRYFF